MTVNEFNVKFRLSCYFKR